MEQSCRPRTTGPRHPRGTLWLPASSRASALEAHTQIRISERNICLSLLSLPPSNYHIEHDPSSHLCGSKIRRADGEINNNCGVGAPDAIRIQRGSKYKHKQTIFILLKDRSILPPPQPRAGWAQEGDESALTWGPSFASSARPAQPWSTL